MSPASKITTKAPAKAAAKAKPALPAGRQAARAKTAHSPKPVAVPKPAPAVKAASGNPKGASAQGSGNPKEEPVSRIRVKIRAYDNRIIDQATKTIVETAERHDAKVVGPVPLPTEKKRFTVNRSTFVHKDAREQFELRVHKRLIDILGASPQAIDALMSLHLPAGVDIEIKM